MRNYVIINGVNSLTIQGLAINNLPPITKPMIRTQREEIDGRDGDIVTELGYSAYDKQMEIGLWGTYDINDIIKYFTGEGTIVFSNEEDKYYNFKILDQIDYEKLLKFKTATITLHCQPFKYPLEEEPIEAEITTLTGTGETLTLNNTEEAPMSLVYKGNTYQDSTTGKNLLSPNFSDYSLDGTYGYIQVIDQAEGLYLSLYEKDSSIDISGVYLGFSGNGINANDGVSWILDSRSTPVSTQIGNTNSQYQYISFYPRSEATFNKIFSRYNVMVRKQSITDNTFEPYTNGASPNPDYPQDIHVVSGDNEISITGKNLLDPNSFAKKVIDSPYSAYNISTYDSETGELNIMMGNGAVVFDNFKSNTQYTFIFKYNSTTNATNLRIDYTNGTNQNISVGSGGRSGTIKIVSVSGRSIKQIVHSAGDSSGSRILYLKESGIFEGVIEETEFEPFGKVYPISLGVENLIKTDFTQTTNTLKVNIPNSKAGYYYFKFEMETPAGDQVTARKTVNGTTTQITYKYNVNELAFTLDENATIQLEIYKSGLTLNDISNAILIKGSTAQRVTDNPIELYKIGDYQDRIYKDSDKWYIEKQIGKVVLDGSENWFQNGTYPNVYGIDNFLTDATTTETRPMLSSAFTYGGLITNGSGEVQINKFYQWIGMPQRLILGYNSTSLADFKTWIGNNNVEVIYPLKTPTYTLIEDSTLIEELESMKKSKEGQTNISQENNDMPFELDVSVTFLTPMEINNIGNIYAKPILTIEGTGNIGVVLNDIQILDIDLTNNGKIAIDVPKLEAYNPDDDTLLNRLVTGDYMKLLINEGENTIKLTGNVSGATLTNYVRWI